MSKSAAGPSTTPAIERLSLGSSSSPSTSRPSHALPYITSPATTSSTGEASQVGSSSGLITPDVLSLSTPTQQYVDSQALHSLATEMVTTLIHSSRFVAKKQALARQELKQAGVNLPLPTSRPTTTSAPGAPAASPPSEVIRSISNVSDTDTLSEIESSLITRLETIGYQVGYSLTEHLSRDRARFSDTLDVLKFICKEVWTAVFGKQVDNLRTNHRGVYVLHDNNFQPLRFVSTAEGAGVSAKEARVFLAYPVGIVRGALAMLDVVSTVVAETNGVPGCTFHVKTQRTAAGGVTGTPASAAPVGAPPSTS